MTLDYTAVTEVSGVGLTKQATEMMVTRYRFGSGLTRGKRVLEVGCGVGQGLGLLVRNARLVVGGDYTLALVQAAHSHYGDRVRALRLDAHRLPFSSGSFDVVLLYETIYYLADALMFVSECARILTSGGTLVICSVNRHWSGFNPSPHSFRYYDGKELATLLEQRGFRPRLLGAFRQEPTGVSSRVIGWIRQLAVRLHLMPRTMKGKELLKRLFYGRLVQMPPELSATDVPAEAPVSFVGDASDEAFKVIYAVGERP